MGGTGTIGIRLDPGYVVGPDEAVNLIVTIGDGTCFTGGEVFFVRSRSAPTPASRQSAPAPWLKPDAAPTD